MVKLQYSIYSNSLTHTLFLRHVCYYIPATSRQLLYIYLLFEIFSNNKIPVGRCSPVLYVVNYKCSARDARDQFALSDCALCTVQYNIISLMFNGWRFVSLWWPMAVHTSCVCRSRVEWGDMCMLHLTSKVRDGDTPSVCACAFCAPHGISACSRANDSEDTSCMTCTVFDPSLQQLLM